MEQDREPRKAQEERFSALFEAWRIRSGRELPARARARLRGHLEQTFSTRGIIWSTVCTFNGGPWTLGGFNDNSVNLGRIEPGEGDEPEWYATRELPYEPIQFSARKDFGDDQMTFRVFVPRFGEILGGPVRFLEKDPMPGVGWYIERTFRDRAKGF